MHIKTSGVFGYLLVRSLAWLKPWRPMSYRYREEQQLIERWLGAGRRGGAGATPALAFEVAECARLIKGYGETHRRGKANFLAIVDALVENPATADAAEQAAAIRKAREAALADPEGKALGSALGKPVVWLKPSLARRIACFRKAPWPAFPSPASAAARQDLYRRMDKHNLAPLWEVLHDLIPNEPVTPLQAGAVEVPRRAALPDGGRQADHRQGGDPPRADPARTRACAASRASRRACTPACSSSCRARSRPATATRSRRCASSSRARAPTPRSTASAPPCAPGDFIITPSWTWHDHGNPGERAGGVDGRPRHPHRAGCSPRSSTRSSRRKCSRCRAAKARRSRATATNLRRSARDARRSARPRRSSTIRTRAAASRSPKIAQGPGSRRLPRLEDASTSTRSPAATPCRPSPPSCSCCRRASGRSPTARTDGTIYSRRRGRGTVAHRRRELRVRAARHLRRALLDAARARGDGRDACCSPSPTGPARRRWACGARNADERSRQGLPQPGVQQPRAGPRPPAVLRALGRSLGARAQHHDLPPRPAATATCRARPSTSSRRARATAAA